ncbi:MAG: DUF748 domain-containing protein [Phycisphaerae bacterium]|nr:DUF748 domain-containing protein [Phycisphaerae bacterium]
MTNATPPTPEPPAAPSSAPDSADRNLGGRGGRLGRWWRRRSRWTRRLLVTALVLAILQPIVGFFLVPVIVRKLVVPQIAKSFAGTVTLEDAQFNPYTWRLGLDGLKVTDPDGRDTLGVKRAEIDFNPLSSLVLPGWRFNDIILDAPYVDAIADAERGLNLARLLVPPAADEPPAPDEPWSAPRFIVGGFEMRDGRAIFDDRTFAQPITTRLDGITFRVENLDTTPPRGSNAETLHSMVAKTAGGATIEWTGTLTLDPPASKGTIVISDIVLPEVGGHATRFTDASVEDGSLDALVTYHFAPLAPTPIARARISKADISSFLTKRPGGVFASLPSLTLYGADVDVVARQVVIERLAVDQGALTLDRDQSGVLNLARMIRERPKGAAIPPPSPARSTRVDPGSLRGPAQQVLTSVSYLLEDLTGDWNVSVQDVEITRQSLTFTDHSTDAPVNLEFRGLDLRAGPVHTAGGFEIPLRVAAVLNGAPSSADGTFSVSKRSFVGNVATEKLGLAPLAPYVRLLPHEPFASAEIDGGDLSAKGSLTLVAAQAPRIEATWSGDLALSGLSTRSRTANAPLLVAGAVTVQGDARADVAGADGVRVGWKGALAGTQSGAGPALLRVLSLGDGDLSIGEFRIDGEVSMAFPTGADAGGSWKGTLAFNAIDATNLAPSGDTNDSRRIAARAASFALNADATLALPQAGGARADWRGSVALTEGAAQELGDRPLDAALASFSLTGDGSIGLEPQGDLSMRWTGATKSTGASARLSTANAELGVGAAELDGELVFRRGHDPAISLSFKGKGSLDGATVAQGNQGEGAQLSNERGAFDGTVEVTADDAGAARLALDGTLETKGSRANLLGEHPVLVSLGGARLVTALQAALDGTSRSAEFSGDVALSTFAIESPSDGIALAGESMTTNGTGRASVTGDRREVRWSGKAASESGALTASKTAGGLTARYAAVTAEGTLEADSRADGADIAFVGTHAGRELHVAAADANGPVTASVASFDGRSTARMSDREGAIEGTIETSARAAGVVADLAGTGGGADARSVRASAAEVDGTTSLRGGTAPVELAWAGRAALDELDAASGAGAERAVAQARRVAYDGSASLAPSDGRTFLTVLGDVLVEAAKASLGDPPALGAEFTSLAIDGVRLSESERHLAADSIELVGLVADGEVQAAVKKPDPAATPREASANPIEAPAQPNEAPATTSAAVAETPTARAWSASVGEFIMRDGTVRMSGTADGAVEGEKQAVVLDQIELVASDLDTRGGVEGTVRLASRLAGSGRLTIDGTIDPFSKPLVADLVLKIDSAPLPPTNPYASRYVGWLISAGRLNTEIPTVVKDGKVKGTLKFTLDGVELGGRANSPDAPDLPLDFALAVLRDSKNQVKGSIPFSGDATSPDFSLSGIIVDVIVSFLGKVVTAPFQLLASAFEGAEDVDLSALPFEPGSTDLGPDSLRVIDVLTRALADRPGLSLAVRGQYAVEADGRAIRLATLKERIAEKARKGFPPRKTVTPELYREYVEDLWSDLPEGKAARKAKRTVSFEEMEDALLATMPFDDAALVDLARRRAESVVTALVGAGIASERLTASAADAASVEQESPRAAIEIGAGSALQPSDSGRPAP